MEKKTKASSQSLPAVNGTAKSRVESVDPYGFERSEDFDYESYEELMSEYLVVLTRRAIKWSKLLKGINKVQKNIKLKRYVRKGIPNEHRALIWMAASGAHDKLEKNPGYYQSLLGARHDPKLVEIICTDLNRTFPDNVQFRKTSNPCLQKNLYNVLLAYGHHNPSVGYCQSDGRDGFGGCQENIPDCLVPTVKFRRDNNMRLFFRVWAWPLISRERQTYALAYQDFLDNAMLPTLWQQFEEGPFLFQHDCNPVHKARTVKTSLVEFGMEELTQWGSRGDCEPGLLVQHQHLTSLMLYRMNRHKFSQK
ncbi:growth hormone-regulated TBC protein 1-A isoform X2 [Cheilinus undulatus]|uniref:growth hormone-regulated TBC protein 1-A isoform X2 n=1 Tax=Cheilinus undulatus TaxID=241271 RepID=UPI001BD644F3|nr:growth hormone-regulated TBC protein 1-A isoform X2 [Cheilinus undulatus]